MKNIEAYFKQLVIQKLMLSDLLFKSFAIGILYVSLIYWMQCIYNFQLAIITFNNKQVKDQLSSNVSLSIYNLESQLSKIEMMINISKKLSDLNIPDGLQLNLISDGNPTYKDQKLIEYINNISKNYLSNFMYYIDMTNNWILSNQTYNITCPENSNQCKYLNSISNYNLLNYNKQQTIINDKYMCFFPTLNLSYYQICGRIYNSVYQCVLHQLYSLKETAILQTHTMINNSVIAPIIDSCLNQLVCAIPNYFQQEDEFLLTKAQYIQNALFVNQMILNQDDLLDSNLIQGSQQQVIQSFFYLSSQITGSVQQESVLSNYTEDIVNQTGFLLKQIQTLNQEFFRIHIMASNSNQQVSTTLTFKQEQFYYFQNFFQLIIFLILLEPFIKYFFTVSDFNQITDTLSEIQHYFEEFNNLGYENMSYDIDQYRKTHWINIFELNELLDILTEFIWLIDFLENIPKKSIDHNKLEIGLKIFKKRDCSDCLELILQKLVQEYSRQKNFEEAIEYNKEIIKLLEKQKSLANKPEDIQKCNMKIFSNLNQLLDLLSKLLIRKKGKDRTAWNQAKQLFTSIMEFADTLEIKFTLQIKLFFKKCKLLFNLRKIKEAEQCIEQAQNILQQNYQLNKNPTYQKQFNQDKKLLQIVQQKIYFYRGLINLSSSQYQTSAQYLMLAIEYGSVYQPKLRVKTIKLLAKLFSKQKRYESDCRILKQIQYYFQTNKRWFQVIVDSTHRMSENLLEILEALKYIFQNMNEDDQISLITFAEYLNVTIPTQSKASLLENKNFLDDGFYEKLSGTQTQLQRKLYNAIIESFDLEVTPKKYSKHLIVIALGDNYQEQVDQLDQACELLREEYCHFILCSNIEKKYINQRNSLYKLTSEARDGEYIDLFVNFDEGLNRLGYLCNQH